jgi:cell fate (sporulation/competence/biofilm development) regulator YlbF (YheA/YmcA/DUF963 family)
MEEIVAKAGKLGEAIAAHESYRALKSATEKLKADEEAGQLEKSYAEVARLIDEKGSAGRPIEPEEKRREAELRSKMAAHPVIREFLKAQANFHQLMLAVNHALESAIDLEK